MSESALHLQDVRVFHDDPEGGRLCVLDLPRLTLARGEHRAVAGESGAGKTTLLDVIAGIRVADEGTIRVAGEAMTGAGEIQRDRLRAAHIGYLFQTFNLLPTLSALENVALGLTFRPGGRTGARDRARAALAQVGLEHRLRHRPHQLSVGQQQRVAMARALVGRPTLLLADEPTSNLDAARAEACLDLLLDAAQACEAALLLVTHDPRALARFPDNVLTLTAPTAKASP